MQKVSIVALPVALALLVCGSVWFQAVHFYLGIKHPAWFVWIALIVIVLWRLVHIGVRLSALHALDITAFLFIAAIVMSLYIKGHGDAQQAAIYLGAFIGLPYLAGRLTDMSEVKLFLISMLAVVALSLPLVTIELMLLPEEDYLDDRVKGLFGAYYINNLVGLTAGGLAALLIAGFVGPCEDLWWRYKVFGLLILAATLWLLVFIAARGGLLAALIVGGASLLLGKWVSVQRRSGLLLFIIVVLGISSQTLPERRVEFFKELLTIGAEHSHHRTGISSPVAHLLDYKKAVRLFLNEPILGVGAGNFGYDVARGQAVTFGTAHSSQLQAFSELGVVGGGLFLVTGILIFVGLIRIAMSTNKVPLRSVAWLILSLWGFLFLNDQISGNYFTSYQFYALTGMAGAVLAAGGIGQWRQCS